MVGLALAARPAAGWLLCALGYAVLFQAQLG